MGTETCTRRRKPAGQGKCSAHSLLDRDSSKCKGLEAGVGGGRCLRTENGGQWGGNMVSKGEKGRILVGWGPKGQHGRLIWVMTVLRDPLGQLQQE